jgi:hypothetical protein
MVTAVADSPAVEVPPSADILPPDSPFAPPQLTLTAPLAETVFPAGAPVSVVGVLTGHQPGQSVQVVLEREDGSPMATVQLLAAEGEWRALLFSSADYAGPLTVVATLLDSNQTSLASQRTPILLQEPAPPDPPAPTETPPPPTGNIAITFTSSPVIAGERMVVRGTARSDRTNFDISLGLYINDCSETPGIVRFRMTGSGNWYAMLTVPEYAPGPFCVRAYLGEPSADNPDQVEVRLIALERGESDSGGVAIALPLPGARLHAPFRVEGVAANAPGSQVTVSARATDGTLLWEEVARADRDGYWQLQMPLADGAYGVTLVARTANGAEATSDIRVIARPTPAAATPTPEPEPASEPEPEPTPSG